MVEIDFEPGVELLACRYCGLIDADDGCVHTRVNFQPPVLSVPIRRMGGTPSHFLGPEPPPVFSIRIHTATPRSAKCRTL